MSTIVLLATVCPSQLAEDLLSLGVRVFEALSFSEVLHLCDTCAIDAVVITSDVAREKKLEISRLYVTLQLQPQATAAEVLWELDQLKFVKRTIQ